MIRFALRRRTTNKIWSSLGESSISASLEPLESRKKIKIKKACPQGRSALQSLILPLPLQEEW